MSSNQGIQTLLEAEKEAAKVVQKAKAYRVQKLKDARTEALKEIEALKAEKNAEFLAFEKSLSSNGQTVDFSDKIDEIDVLFKKNKKQVIDKLLHAITDVKPEIHINVAKG